jgi:CRISPR system Cascade subunit CasD
VTPRSVLFRLEGPLQAYGVGARFEVRTTGREPSKSAVVGIVCAVLGVARDDEAMIARIARLELAVRVDREGGLLRDYQTVGGGDYPGRDDRDQYGVVSASGRNVGTVQTVRFYLTDASFLCALGGDDRELVDRIAGALEDPVHDTFLGRRACVPSRPLPLGAVDLDPVGALHTVPWRPRPNERPRAALRTVVEGGVEDLPRWDHPVSFAIGARQHALRHVREGAISVTNLPGGAPGARPEPTPHARPAGRRVVRRVRSLAVPSAEEQARRAELADPVYLSRLVLELAQQDVVRDLRDAHDLHRTLLDAFPPPEDWAWGVRQNIDPRDEARAFHGLLHRLDRSDGETVLLVQSGTKPEWGRLPAGYLRERPRVDRVEGLWSSIRAGDKFYFCVRAVWRTPVGNLDDEAAHVARMRATGPQIGVTVLCVDEVRIEQPEVGGAHGRRTKGEVAILPVRLTGRLRVVDADLLRLAMRRGLGAKKAYGCGLLSLRPWRTSSR